MSPKSLTAVHVYLSNDQKAALEKAAAKENRSLSNYLLNLGVRRAMELGIDVPGFRPHVPLPEN